MPTPTVRQEDLRREIQRLSGSKKQVFRPLIESWPGPDYDPQDPSTYPDGDDD